MSDHRDDFVSFEKALRELKMRSEELKKLVSEGEIRAFRDGDSMKFRQEDIEALNSKSKGEEDLAFVDSLEDDTGMVTEQLSDEDTLLAEEDLEKPRRGAARRTVASAPTLVAVGAPVKEPGWVTAVAILAFVALVWGFMINYSISKQVDPTSHFFTSVFAQPAKK